MLQCQCLAQRLTNQERRPELPKLVRIGSIGHLEADCCVATLAGQPLHDGMDLAAPHDLAEVAERVGFKSTQ